MESEIKLTKNLTNILHQRSNETGVPIDDLLNEIIINEIDNYPKKMVKLSDIFSDLNGIIDCEETNAIDLRDKARERRL